MRRECRLAPLCKASTTWGVSSCQDFAIGFRQLQPGGGVADDHQGVTFVLASSVWLLVSVSFQLLSLLNDFLVECGAKKARMAWETVKVCLMLAALAGPGCFARDRQGAVIERMLHLLGCGDYGFSLHIRPLWRLASGVVWLKLSAGHLLVGFKSTSCFVRQHASGGDGRPQPVIFRLSREVALPSCICSAARQNATEAVPSCADTIRH